MSQNEDTNQPHDANDAQDMVKVYQSDNLGRFLLAKTYLDSIEIPHLEKNEEFQDLLGYGRFPFGINVVAGPMEIWVNSKDVEDAVEILRDLEGD